MKVIFTLLVSIGLCFFGNTQSSVPDSLRKIFNTATDDSILYRSSVLLYDYYEEVKRDSALFFADQCLAISRRNGKKINEAHVLTRKAYQELNLGRFAEALKSLLLSFELSQDTKNENLGWRVGVLGEGNNMRLYALNTAHHIYGILMIETLNNEQALVHFKEAKRIAITINSPIRSLLASLNLGRLSLVENKFDSVLLHENEAEEIARKNHREKYLSTILNYSGRAYLGKGDTTRALQAFYESIESALQQTNTDALTRTYYRLSAYHLNTGRKDSGVYYAKKSLEEMKKMGATTQSEYNLGNAYDAVSIAFRSNSQFDSANIYLALANVTKDSISQRRIKSLAEFQKLTLNEQQRLQESEKEKVAYRNRVRTIFMLSGIGLLLLMAIVFYRNNRQKQKAKNKIEKAYLELKTTQQQLIQSEKMASLGELTAGIAHEIQNPLNFINNFSEVNKELLGEMKEEIQKGNLSEVNVMAQDIMNNEEKIVFHGKRADAIVKSMLQHSRASNGKREMTDINALADEYLRLSYHGLRAKDKSFNAQFELNKDESLPKINVVPQDIGRVLLNLINNAFYAVTERKKLSEAGYQPTVTVTTRSLGDKVQIVVRDNGTGIPKEVLEKIFQPFFTTKPSGQGTGLGLSLSYDIITKGHGGELRVESKEGEGSALIIKLPIKS